MFDGLDKVFTWLFILAGIGIVLGTWKLVEIIIWLVHHVKIVWS